MLRVVRLLARLAGSFWARVVVSLGLLTLVATQIDFGRGVRRLAEGQWEWFVLATFALVAAFTVASFRWHLYLVACDVDPRSARSKPPRRPTAMVLPARQAPVRSSQVCRARWRSN